MSRRPVRLAAVALAALLAGCSSAPAPPPGPAAPPRAVAPAPAAPPERTMVVLLPDADGGTGAVAVRTAGGERVLSAPRQGTAVAAASVAPGEPRVLGEEEIGRIFGAALAARPEPPARFLLYFKRNSSELTEEAQLRVREAVQAVRRRSSTDVSVVGHSDTLGDR